MKDAKGHGSDQRGMRAGRGTTAVQARNNRMHKMFDDARARGHTGLYSGPQVNGGKPVSSNAAAADELMHTMKSTQAPVHDAMGPGYNVTSQYGQQKTAEKSFFRTEPAFKSSLPKSAGHSYLDPHDPRGRR